MDESACIPTDTPSNRLKHVYGGTWTEQKLGILKNYLFAYSKVLEKTGLNLYYIDAFAGTGSRDILRPSEGEQKQLTLEETAEREFFDGSARIALDWSNHWCSGR